MSNKLRLLAFLAAGTIVTAATPLASLADSPVQFRQWTSVDRYDVPVIRGNGWTPVDRYGVPVIYGNDEVAPTAAPCLECIWLPTYNDTVNGQRVLVPGHWERVPGHRPPPRRPATHLHDD